MIAFNTIIGLTIANFGYQLMTVRDWGTASERTWFQVIAILVITYLHHMMKEDTGT